MINFRTTMKASASFWLVCLNFLAPDLKAQCSLACNDQIVVNVPTGGTYELLPQTAAASDLSVFCPNGVISTQILDGNTWIPASGNVVFDDSQVGQLYQYRIQDSVTGNWCWGQVEVAGQSPANDTIHFRLSAELWSDGRPVYGATLVFQPINPAFPYSPMVFTLDEDENAMDLAIVPSDYMPGTTFSYSATLPDTGYHNGVGILDLCKIHHHLLGIDPLPSPYAMLAADINKSGSVTTFDVIQGIRLKITQTFFNNGAWRFIPDYCVFPNPANPFWPACNAEISMTELAALDNDTARVIAIKVGDVDGDVQLPGTLNPDAGIVDSITMLIPQGSIPANTPVAVPVKLDKDFTYGGTQLVIRFAPDIFLFDSISDGAIPKQSSFGNVHFDTASNELRMLRYNLYPSNPITIPANEPLFYIHLKSTQTVQLQDVMQLVIDDQGTPSILIGNNCSGVYKMGYTYSGFVPVQTPLARGVQLQPPSPNPFTSHSWLELELEQSENVWLEMADLTGRVLHSETRQLNPGTFRWELPVDKIPSGTMCFWRLVIAGKSASGKLVRN
ncbi:MAG: hypothetical protein IT261_08030 [Saprospiraceae bacterium]|nr:hypothetical protein [Saprospiraceae bacterium]